MASLLINSIIWQYFLPSCNLIIKSAFNARNTVLMLIITIAIICNQALIGIDRSKLKAGHPN